MTIYAIDYDDTIHNTKDAPQGRRMGQPMPGAITALKRLHNRGDKIIIFTARDVQKPQVKKAIADWMDFWGIPFDDITNVKQSYMDLFVDNRAVHFDTWPQTLNRLTHLTPPVHQHGAGTDKI